MSRLTDEFLAEVVKKANYITEKLKSFSKVKAVTGLGLMIGVCVDDVATTKLELEKLGLIVLTAKDKLRLLPALTITQEEIDKGLNIMEKVLG